MNLINKINELINLLDKNEDSILIIALQSKIKQINQEYLSKYDVNEIELINAKAGVKRTINSWIRQDINNNEKIIKINRILKNSRDCDDCKHSIIQKNEYYEYNAPDHNNIKCDSCIKWADKLIEERTKEREKEERKYYDYYDEIPEEIFKIKALMNKLQNKIIKLHTIKNK